MNESKVVFRRIAFVAIIVAVLFASYFILPKAGDSSLIQLEPVQNTQSEAIAPVLSDTVTFGRDTVLVYVDVFHDPDSVFVIPVLRFVKPDTLQQ